MPIIEHYQYEETLTSYKIKNQVFSVQNNKGVRIGVRNLKSNENKRNL